MRRAVEIADLSFTWGRSKPPVLHIERFLIDEREALFIKGASGSGKSTLLGLITGILVPQQGAVTILDERVSELGGTDRDRYRADHIGYIFQMFNLIPYLSVIENVVLPCRFSPVRKNRALRQAASLEDEALRILSRLNLVNNGLLNKPVVELSVGQQQRVAAARALIGSPALVIADEPTSSLDADQRELFLELLFDECSKTGATLIFVSHDANLAPLFNRVVDIAEINRAAPAGGEGRI